LVDQALRAIAPGRPGGRSWTATATVRAAPGAPWIIATAKPATRSAPVANSPVATGPSSGRESMTSLSNGFVGSGLRRAMSEPPAFQAAITSRCSEEAGSGSASGTTRECSGCEGSNTSL
jgi:hypothetical protein